MKPLPSASLHTLNTSQLLSLIKKSKWSGGSRERIDDILQILTSRGLDQNTLRRMASLHQDPLKDAIRHYTAFKQLSKKVFILYFIFVASLLASYLLEPSAYLSLALLGMFSILLAFVFASLMRQSRFYQAVGEYPSEGSPLLFFFLGMPLYFLMYFSFKQKMEAILDRLV